MLRRHQAELNTLYEEIKLGHHMALCRIICPVVPGGGKSLQTTNDVDPSRSLSGYITTYQAITQTPDLHAHEFALYRYILVLDEPHHVEENGAWERAIAPLVDKAVMVVLMSGTLALRTILLTSKCDDTNEGRPPGWYSPCNNCPISAPMLIVWPGSVAP